MRLATAVERPLRVAFVSEHASPVALLGSQDAGGQNVYVDEVSRHLARLGYAVDVFTRRDDPSAPEVIEWAPGVRVVNLSAGPPELMLKDQLWPLMPAFRGALHDFMLRDGDRYDVLHGNFWMSGWVVAQLARQLAIPAVHIFHAMGKTKQRHQGQADTSPDGRIAVELEVIRAVDRVIAQCPSERNELVDDYGADPGKVALIPSAVNIQRFRPLPRDEARRRIGLESDELVIAYVGRMMPRKDVRNLVRAAALLARQTELRFTVLLVGGETAEPDPVATPEIGVLQALAAELGIAERVRFVGKRQPDVLHEYYSAGDVIVTTPWYEPFGLTPLEGMACGRPVIGSAVGGITYTLADGVTGLLVPPREPHALAAALQKLLMDDTLRETMGRAARERVERKFTWATVAERTAALYQTLLDSPPQARVADNVAAVVDTR
ncbi:MAG: glycosyltransferase [Chloroflexota bacterium]|nr:glycosyltransferase [Chloroflexota bacterium]PLS79815.1 MAG: glycosyltransferase family 1 protein [Chloroflexota bacterium]